MLPKWRNFDKSGHTVSITSFVFQVNKDSVREACFGVKIVNKRVGLSVVGTKFAKQQIVKIFLSIVLQTKKQLKVSCWYRANIVDPTTGQILYKLLQITATF